MQLCTSVIGARASYIYLSCTLDPSPTPVARAAWCVRCARDAWRDGGIKVYHFLAEIFFSMTGLLNL